MKKLFGIVVLLMALCCCHNDSKSNVPDYPVCLDLQITTQYSHFIPENGFQTMTFTEAKKAGEYVGYAGVLVWINTLNEYRAADLACPNCRRRDIPVEIDGLYAKCPICKEEYDLSQCAFPTKGISNQALREYSTQLVTNGFTKILRVRN